MVCFVAAHCGANLSKSAKLKIKPALQGQHLRAQGWPRTLLPTLGEHERFVNLAKVAP
jgi:hypothetical protein